MLPAPWVSDRSPETPTFVFTDLESSTRLWERFPDEMIGAVERRPDGRLLVCLRRRESIGIRESALISVITG